MMEAEQDRRTGLHGAWVPHDGPGRFQAARLQWLERELHELKSRVKTHETNSGGYGAPAWQQADGLWMQSDAQQASQDYIPPPPPVRTEEKKPEGGKANFDWGANNPEVLVKEEMKDDLRAINVTLPKLPDESAPQAALRCGDWITEIEPLIGDVSGGAARWWIQLMVEVNAVYKVWLSSDALTRLEVDAQVKRLEGRVTSVLLAALPTSIKSDVIANRKLTAASIMLEVMKRFQPGGLGEKSGLLRALTAPETATSPADGVEKLRLWSRNVARAVELGVTLPDPVLQIGALDSICRQILNKEPQINFRVQSWRHSNNLDTTTQQSVVTRFAQLLQAELTTAALAGDRKDTPEVKVEQLQQNSDKPVTKVARRNWCTSTGCARGASCRFAHDWTGVQDKNDRCWICSSLGHRKHECPAGDKTKSPEKAENKGKDIKEGKDYTNSKGKGKATGKGKPQLNKTTSSAATTASSTTPASDAAGGGSGNSQAVENAETSTMATRSASAASEKPPAVGDGGK